MGLRAENRVHSSKMLSIICCVPADADRCDEEVSMLSSCADGTSNTICRDDVDDDVVLDGALDLLLDQASAVDIVANDKGRLC